MSKYLKDGFKTTISFAENPTVKLKEKSITPPGIVGRGANNVTTMRNTRMVTKAPKQLIDVSDITGTCSYDPAVYDDCIAMVQVVQAITVTFPDSSTLVCWGWLDEFKPKELQEGSQPEADFTVIIGNLDDNDDEVEPTYAD